MIERIPYICCPICNHTSEDSDVIGKYSVVEHPLWTPDFETSIEWRVCRNCGHVHASGYFSNDDLLKLAQNTPAEQQPGVAAEANRLNASSTVAWVDQRSLERGPSSFVTAPFSKFGHCRWLDVGIGSGALLAASNELGYDTTGLDIRPDTVKEFREYGALEGNFETIDPAKLESPFDVISMADVLEHMAFPVSALQKAQALLRPGGLLYLSTPNGSSYAFKELDLAGTNPYWHELEHYHIFELEQLVKLLAEQGLLVQSARASLSYRLGIELIAAKRM
jgi:protein O-GlcNAc transferase